MVILKGGGREGEGRGRRRKGREGKGRRGEWEGEMSTLKGGAREGEGMEIGGGREREGKGKERVVEVVKMLEGSLLFFYVPLVYILHLLESCRFSKRICFPGQFRIQRDSM